MHSTHTFLLSGLIVLGLFALAVPLAPAAAQNEQWSDTIVCTALQYNLRYGSTDRYTRGEVSTLQGFLQAKGYLNAPKSGFFGPLTLRAAKQYQALNGLPPTGWVWPLTRAKIKAETCGASGGTAIIGPTAPSLGQAQPATPPQTTHPAPPLTPAPVTSVPLPTPVPESAGFTWGVNAHPLYESHRNVSAVEHLDAVKGLGMTSLRVDVYDATPTTLARLDTYVAEGKKRGISILPVLYQQIATADTLEALRTRSYTMGRTLALRFQNDIRTWELSNEMDNHALLTACEVRDDGTTSSCAGQPDGQRTLDYKKIRYEQGRASILGFGEGVRSVDPLARRVVNFSAWHIGFIERLVADGVSFDIVGWHWYNGEYSLENVNGVNLIQKIAAHGKPIWMTEFNKWQGSRAGEAAQAAELQKLMDHFTKLASAYKITGAHIYELYDNPSEPDFGLLKLTSTGGAGAKKVAYDAVRSRILGTTGQTPSAIEILGTPPVRPDPTVTFTVNGAASITLNPGDVFRYEWSASNADAYSSNYSATCANGTTPSGAWIANNISGSESGNLSDPAAYGCTYLLTYTAKQSGSGKQASKTITVKINSTYSSIGTAPTLPATPTATLTFNGKTDTTINVGEAFRYEWSSANADTYRSKYTVSCVNGAAGEAAWAAETASGSVSGNIAPDAAGCTYIVTYTAASKTGESASASVKVRVTSAAAASARSNSQVAGAGRSSQFAGVAAAFPIAGQANPALSSNFSYTFTLDLYRGQDGAETRALQQALTAEGVFSDEATGNFRDQTVKAVKLFQSKYGISATGYVGAITRAQLNALYFR